MRHEKAVIVIGIFHSLAKHFSLQIKIDVIGSCSSRKMSAILIDNVSSSLLLYAALSYVFFPPLLSLSQRQSRITAKTNVHD